MDRDGVLNEERGEYTFLPELFIIRPGVPEALSTLKNLGYKLIVITNQSGLSKNIFTREQMEACHMNLHRKTNYLIDDIFYSPYNPEVTESLSRKPGTLLFERAIAIHKIDASRSWMIGDSDRDMIPAMKLGIRTIFVGPPQKFPAVNASAPGLPECMGIITSYPVP